MKIHIHLLAAAALSACAGLAAAAPVAVTGDIHSFANAFAVDPAAFDLGADPDIDDATTVPHASLIDTAAGPFDYYRVDLASGGSLTLDVDYSDGRDHAGLGLDLQLAVWTLGGTLLATDDDDPRDTENRDAASICAELLTRAGNDFDDFARHLVALPQQIVDIARSAVDSGHAYAVTDIEHLSAALPPELRR